METINHVLVQGNATKLSGLVLTVPRAAAVVPARSMPVIPVAMP
jgi:hypothetical protein